MASVFAAARSGRIDLLTQILDSGFPVNERFNGDRTALHFACDACQLKSVQILLQRGADPNAQDLFNRDTPLHIAAEKGQLAIVKALLDYNANPNLTDQLNEETPLHLACEGGHLDVVRCLLENGANPKALNIYQKTAFFYSPVEIRQSVGLDVNGETPSSSSSSSVSSPPPPPSERDGGRLGKDMERAKAIAQSSVFRQEGDNVILQVTEGGGGGKTATSVVGVGGVKVLVGAYSQAGEDPGGAAKSNQDSYFYETELGGDANLHMMGVFDGHGRHGHMVSQFCRSRFVSSFPIAELKLVRGNAGGIEQLLHRMFVETQTLLERQKDFDAQGSGTTAVVVLVVDGVLYTANCGDSRAVLGRRSRTPDGKEQIAPVALSADHIPDVPSERDRVLQSGGLVRRDTDEFTGEVGPLRIWRKDLTGPGLAMTRSLGDLGAHRIGVSAVPEVTRYKVEEDDLFFIAASDGIWDMISNEQVIQICYQANGMMSSACQQLHDIAREAWKLKEARVDDISAVAVQFQFPKMLYAL